MTFAHNPTETRINHSDFVTMDVAGQLFGIPVLQVQDILMHQSMTHIPLAPNEIKGNLNLRGRIVTAIDMRKRIGMVSDLPSKAMNVVVEYKGEPYSLIVDSVGEVMSLPPESFEKNPGTLDPRWRDVSAGIYRLPESLLIVLDIDRLFSFVQDDAA